MIQTKITSHRRQLSGLVKELKSNQGREIQEYLEQKIRVLRFQILTLDGWD